MFIYKRCFSHFSSHHSSCYSILNSKLDFEYRLYFKSFYHVSHACLGKKNDKWIANSYGKMNKYSSQKQHGEYIKRKNRAEVNRALRCWRNLEMAADDHLTVKHYNTTRIPKSFGKPPQQNLDDFDRTFSDRLNDELKRFASQWKGFSGSFNPFEKTSINEEKKNEKNEKKDEKINNNNNNNNNEKNQKNEKHNFEEIKFQFSKENKSQNSYSQFYRRKKNYKNDPNFENFENLNSFDFKNEFENAWTKFEHEQKKQKEFEKIFKFIFNSNESYSKNCANQKFGRENIHFYGNSNFSARSNFSDWDKKFSQKKYAQNQNNSNQNNFSKKFSENFSENFWEWEDFSFGGNFSGGSKKSYSENSKNNFSEEKKNYEEKKFKNFEEKFCSHRTLLGLSQFESITSDSIKKAFHQSALLYHPDRHTGKEKIEAEEKFKAVAAAYEALKLKI